MGPVCRNTGSGNTLDIHGFGNRRGLSSPNLEHRGGRTILRRGHGSILGRDAFDGCAQGIICCYPNFDFIDGWSHLGSHPGNSKNPAQSE